ncbi:MAG: hypothetical protein GX550_01235 [Syntrophomonadaceae bacterium]|nr:hypothetical protein [Syntrophomonadaceae bacterium]
MVYKRIERDQKNAMRSNLEKVLENQKSLGEKIDSYQQSTNVGEYREFWRELKNRNNETIHIVSRYMINKCNR